MSLRHCLLVLPLLLVALSARADDVASGPATGANVPAAKVFDATGPHKDKQVDYAADRKDKPTIYLFIQSDKFDRPMNRFMKTLDDQVKKDSEDAYVVAVWLTDDTDREKEKLPRIQQSVQYQSTALTIFAGKDGPKGWNVNPDAHLTVVIANKGKVAQSIGYRTVNATDVPKVREALRKALDKK